VQLLELGAIQGERYLAMQWLDGVDLRLVLKQCAWKGIPVPPGLACFIVSEIASALAYAHSLCDEQGRPLEIIHRDVNPSNVFVTNSGRLVLLDFGIARAACQLERQQTEAGLVKGTVGYMAPEQAKAEPLDGRTDVFALGAVLYECLTGRPAFRGRNPLETVQLICGVDAAPPSLLRPELETEIDQVVRKALARNKDRRYSSASALVEALRPIVSRHQADAAKLSAFVAAVLAEKEKPSITLVEALPSPFSATQPSERGTLPLGCARRTRPVFRDQPARKLRSILSMAAMIAVCVGLISYGRDTATRSAIGVPPPSSTRRQLAVLGFRNVSGRPEDAWLSGGLSEMLSAELRLSDHLDTLSTEEVAHMKAELGLSDSATLSKASLAHIRHSIGADLALVGSYAIAGAKGEQLRVDLWIQDCVTGDIVSSVAQVGTEADLFELVAGLGRKTRDQLVPHVLADAHAAALQGALAAAAAQIQ
jgi:TolB-like protein